MSETVGFEQYLAAAEAVAGRITSLRAAKELLPDLEWREQKGATGDGIAAYTVIGGDKGTGEIHVLAILEGRGAAAPRHRHNKGETIRTLAGALLDIVDGRGVTHRPGDDDLVHGEGSEHQPFTNGFWFGYYYQPEGMTLLPDQEEPVTEASVEPAGEPDFDASRTGGTAG